MEYSEYTDTGEDSKCDIVHQLMCMACLGSGQTLHILRDEALKLYKLAVNDGRQLVHNITARVCWECEVLLKRVLQFRERVTECHHILDSARVTRSDVTRAPRLQVHCITAIDIPPLKEIYIKREIETDVYNIPEMETDVHIKLEASETEESSPCPACLCAGRLMITLRDKELHYYRDILTQNRVESSVTSPRLCWECRSVLLRATRFSEQAAESYRTLLPSLQHADVQDITTLLCSGVSLPPRLRRCVRACVDIPPHAHTHKHDAHEQRRGDEPPLMSNYRGHDINNAQSENTDAHTRTEVMKDVKTINTRNSTHESTGGVKQFVCDYCYKRFTSKAAVERHIATYNIYLHNNRTVPSPCEDCAVVLCSDDQCSECPNKHNLLQHINMETNVLKKLYQCEVCHKLFSYKSNLQRHKKTHSGEASKHQCGVCQKWLTQKSNLKAHLRTHTGEKQFQCEVCHKPFSRKSTLADHTRTHTGERPFSCKVCHKLFSRKSNLEIHLRIHTGEKPFQCEMCHKSFSLKNTLARHIRTHTGEKPFQCEMCHKPFTQKSNLVDHLRTHTGEKFQCEICHKSFSQKSTFANQIKTHTGEKPFQCEMCHKPFTQKSILVDHLRTHTGEKPFQCKVCHKQFSQKYSLLTHSRTHIVVVQ